MRLAVNPQTVEKSFHPNVECHLALFCIFHPAVIGGVSLYNREQ